MSDTFFSKIISNSDREKTFSGLVEVAKELQCQVEGGVFFRCKVLGRDRVGVQVIPMDRDPIDHHTPAIVTFTISNEIYFMRTEILPGGGVMDIDLSADLYKLMRRKAFRVVIPASLAADFELEKVGIQKIKGLFAITDLSAGGFAFESDIEEHWIAGTKVKGYVKVGLDFMESITGVVRHVRALGPKPSRQVRVGIEFDDLPESQNQKFVQLVFSIHSGSRPEF